MGERITTRKNPKRSGSPDAASMQKWAQMRAASKKPAAAKTPPRPSQGTRRAAASPTAATPGPTRAAMRAPARASAPATPPAKPKRRVVAAVASKAAPAVRVVAAAPTPSRPTQRSPTLTGLRRSRRIGMAVAIVGIAVVAAVAAAVLLRQDITLNPTAATPDVVFANGNDYSDINAAGFATITLGSSSTSATIAVSGVPGVADLQLGDLLKITNQDGSQGYNLTLTRSTVPDAAITEFDVQVFNATDTLVASWDAVAGASSSTFSLPASTTYDIRIDILVADGTTPGALTGFDMQFELAPV